MRNAHQQGSSSGYSNPIRPPASGYRAAPLHPDSRKTAVALMMISFPPASTPIPSATRTAIPPTSATPT